MRRNERVEWHFPERLQEAMADSMVTAEDLAFEDICSETSTRAYLEGKQIPNLRIAQRLSEFLGVSLDWLCGGNADDDWN